MNTLKPFLYLLPLSLILNLQAADWPVWGGNASRNMVSPEKKVLFDFDPGDMGEDEKVDLKTTKNIKWVAKLGSQAYGNVTIANGATVMVYTDGAGSGAAVTQVDLLGGGGDSASLQGRSTGRVQPERAARHLAAHCPGNVCR